MKTWSYNLTSLILGLILSIFTFSACTQSTDQSGVTEKNENVRMEQPENLGMSSDTLNMRVQEMASEEVESRKSELIEEAADALAKTYEALGALTSGDNEVALEALAAATGKFEILLARDPEMALVPIEETVETHDLVTDLETIRDIKKAATKALKEGYFQEVRDILQDLASEIQINTVMLPLGTYPEVMKVAAAFIENGKPELAQLALLDAINTLVIEETRVPLPILRAEVMIAEAMSLDASDEDHKQEILDLLSNAEYQLIMSEELGYGKKDKEYKELYTAIKDLKKSVEGDQESQGLFKALKEKLAKFKDRIVG